MIRLIFYFTKQYKLHLQIYRCISNITKNVLLTTLNHDVPIVRNKQAKRQFQFRMNKK